MIDYNTLYFILFFIFWVYLLDLTIEKKDYIAFKYIQFIFVMPLIVFLANNSYVQDFIFGYVICGLLALISLYVLVMDYIN